MWAILTHLGPPHTWTAKASRVGLAALNIQVQKYDPLRIGFGPWIHMLIHFYLFIYCCRNRNCDGTTNQQLNLEKNRVRSRHHSYYRKLWNIIKKSKVCEKPDFGSRSRLRVGKV